MSHDPLLGIYRLALLDLVGELNNSAPVQIEVYNLFIRLEGPPVSSKVTLPRVPYSILLHNLTTAVCFRHGNVGKHLFFLK